MNTTPLPNQPAAPPPPHYQPAYRPRSWINPWLIRLPVLGISGGFLLVLVLGLFLAAYQIRHKERIFPGVSVYGVNVGGQTIEEAKTALAGRFSYPAEAVFTFRDGDRVWQMTASDLGVSFDLDATIQQAFDQGHTTNLVNGIMEQGSAWFNGMSIAPVMSYDEGIAAAKLNAIAAEIDRQPINASLVMNGNNVQTTEGQTGRMVDTAATLARLRDGIMRLETGVEVALVINETPPQVWNVDEPAAKIRAALSAPLTLIATDDTGQTSGPWIASVDQIASLLKVERLDNGDGTQSYTVDIDMSAFEGYLNTLAPGLIASPRNGRFHFNLTTGQLEVIQRAVSGRTLNIPATLEAMKAAVFTPDSRTVSMVFDYTLPPYHNQVTAAELGIIQVVAESTTYYAGSGQNRRSNIALSASKFDGIIIAPGEEFSFNDLLGPIGPETGFLEDKVIFGGRTTLGYGGGACQVSTTAYRAAFAGGFAITERNSHGYRVGYYEQQGYPPGLDAAIWQPERDFRFQNNTPYHLLIETSVLPAENALRFRFYSTKHWNAEIQQAVIKDTVPPLPDQYEVNNDLKPGEILQVDYSAEGADVTIYRKVYDMQGNLVLEDAEYTHYLPWAAIYQVPPGDARLRS